MENVPITYFDNRLGIHYFPDINHYRDKDFSIWIPKIKAMGIQWITLISPFNNLIPENFIKGIISHNIQPILHFPFRPDSNISKFDISNCLKVYSNWGVQFVVFFDRPNSRLVWNPSSWAQENLIERFIDSYLILAEIAISNGLTLIFPPLIPGGDYWDTIFLRSALRSIERRGYYDVLENLIIGVDAYAGNRPLNWGHGGPDRWIESPPYSQLPGEEDHLGFRIFEWYQAIVSPILGKPCKMILFRAGSYPCPNSPQQEEAELTYHDLRNLAIAVALKSEYCQLNPASFPELPEIVEPIPPEVLSCNFWLLSASSNSRFSSQAWFKPDGSQLTIVDYLEKLNQESRGPTFDTSLKTFNIAYLDEISPRYKSTREDESIVQRHYIHQV